MWSGVKGGRAAREDSSQWEQYWIFRSTPKATVRYCIVNTWVLVFFYMLENDSCCSKTKMYFFIVFHFSDGSEIPASTLMEILLMNDFKLVINKITYDVQCPKKGK